MSRIELSGHPVSLHLEATFRTRSRAPVLGQIAVSFVGVLVIVVRDLGRSISSLEHSLCMLLDIALNAEPRHSYSNRHQGVILSRPSRNDHSAGNGSHQLILHNIRTVFLARSLFANLPKLRLRGLLLRPLSRLSPYTHQIPLVPFDLGVPRRMTGISALCG